MKSSIFALFLMGSVSIAGTFSIDLENDILFETDRRYTHGTRFSYETENQHIWSLGQNIYTPSDISISTPITNDRPYAGLLYVGFTKTEEFDYLYRQTDIRLGIVGEHSFSDVTQEKIHEWIDSRKPMGWEYQVEDKLLLEFAMKHTLDLTNNKYYTVRPYLNAEVGTIFQELGAGINMMTGLNFPSIMEPPIISKKETWNLYLYADWYYRLVINNYLLKSEYTDITPENIITDNRTGIGIGYKNFELRYGICIRSKEFKEQAASTRFGTVTIKVNF